MNKEILEIVLGFKRTLRLLEKPERSMLLFASLIMLVTGILTNLPALILGKLVDRLIAQDIFQFNQVAPFIALIVLIIFVREALTVLRKYLVENIATQTEKKQTVATVEHLLKTDVSIINQQQIGALHGRVFRSIQGLIRIIKLGFLDFLPILFSAVAAIVIAVTQKPMLASVMVLVIPTGLFIIFKQISSQKGIRVALLRGKEKIDGTVVEALGGLETVRALNTTDHEIGRIEHIAEELRRKEIRHHLSMASYDALKYFNESFFYILVICIAIFFSAQGIISRGDILVYSILFLSIIAPLREIHRILDQAHESSILVNDLYHLRNVPVDESFKVTVSKKELNPSVAQNNAILELTNLSFTFPNWVGKVIDKINIKIRYGEKIGIVGVSGSGKSTLIKIVLRLIHGYSGQVRLFGKDLKTITRDEIAEKIAYVPQNTYVFSGTIKENIIYGVSGTVSDEQIIQAAKKANIYNEIVDSLGGLQGRVTENGNNLSGGQRQRLAIARLILKSPKLFIFDEATSALDNTNEALIQENINKTFKDRTMIVIAHRLTTLKNTDRIYVFDKQRIVQEGTYTELASKKGLFQDLLKQRIPLE